MQYQKLVEAFLNNSISALEFEKQFLDLTSKETKYFTDNEDAIISDLFRSVDDFCPDEHLRGEFDIDEQQLRKKCEEALEGLNKIAE